LVSHCLPGALVRMQIGRAASRAALLLVVLCDQLMAVEQDRPNHADSASIHLALVTVARGTATARPPVYSGAPLAGGDDSRV
jgi:hypothetical protein